MGLRVNDVTRLPGSNKSQTTRRDVVKFSPRPGKDITICFANERPIGSIRSGAQSISQSPIPSFTFPPGAKLIFQNFSWLTRRSRAEEREKRLDWHQARESFYGANETESRSRETRSTSRKRRGKVYANLVARVSRQAKSVSGHASPPSNG